MVLEFLTVPDELVEYAQASNTYYSHHGYRIKIEPHETGFPHTPTLACRRHQTVVYVEVVGAIDQSLASDWARFSKSRSRDTRIVLSMPDDRPRRPEDESFLREYGIGLLLCGDRTILSVTPRDLAVNLEPPDLSRLSPRVRTVLGTAYEQFELGNWRECFEEACKALEQQTCRYLKKGLSSGRVKLIHPSGSPRAITARQVEKLTLGQLAVALSQISARNKTDTIVAGVLENINKDRVNVVHHKSTAQTENRLRKNVGKHMWEIVQAITEIA